MEGWKKSERARISSSARSAKQKETMLSTPKKAIAFEVPIDENAPSPSRKTPAKIIKKIELAKSKAAPSPQDIAKKLEQASLRKKEQTEIVLKKAKNVLEKVQAATERKTENARRLSLQLEAKQTTAAALHQKEVEQKKKRASLHLANVEKVLEDKEAEAIPAAALVDEKLLAASERRKALEIERTAKLAQRHKEIQEVLSAQRYSRYPILILPSEQTSIVVEEIEEKLEAAEQRRKKIEEERLQKLSRRHSSIQDISEAAAAYPLGDFVSEKLEKAESRRRALDLERKERSEAKKEHAMLVRKRKSLAGSSVEDLQKPLEK